VVARPVHSPAAGGEGLNARARPTQDAAAVERDILDLNPEEVPMTKDNARLAFEQMDTERLLANVAFFANEFSAEGLTLLKAVAEERGITEETVRAHRASVYPGIEFPFKCDSCKCDLLLTEEEFVDGQYTCADCFSSDVVRYLDLALPPSAVDVATSVLLSRGLFGHMRDTGKRAARRGAIEDGSYWLKLRRGK
jgi:hypothetical protein